jgi:hypothetical protein
MQPDGRGDPERPHGERRSGDPVLAWAPWAPGPSATSWCSA